MILRIHSDASYLCTIKTRSQAVVFYHYKDTESSLLNSTIYVLCTILKNIMAYVAEDETYTVFVNC